jgi:hypothetical protein
LKYDRGEMRHMLEIGRKSSLILFLFLTIYLAFGQVAASSFDIQVFDPAGEPVQDAMITVSNNTGYIDGGTTNSDGIFETDLTKGVHYSISAKNSTSSVKKSIIAGNENPIVLTLAPQSRGMAN